MKQYSSEINLQHANSSAQPPRRAGALMLWLFLGGLTVMMLFKGYPLGYELLVRFALVCAAGWLATSAWLIAKAREGDSSKRVFVPTLVVFAIVAGFHLLWATTPFIWRDPATYTILASMAETVLASAILFLRFAVVSRRRRRLLCTAVVLATLALLFATVETVGHYIIC